MGVKIRNLENAIVNLKLKGDRISDTAKAGLRDAAYEVQELAQAYVPIDEENLQEAISVRETADGYQVYIDLSHKGTRASTVREYAFRIHEGVGYSGVARAGWPRGMKFMSRAGSEVENKLPNTIIPDIQARIRAVARGTGGFFGRLGRGIRGLFGR